jgi:hypothetical protein
MKYIQVQQMLSKQAYGGNLEGDPHSYYDRADFYSIDPDFDDVDLLRNRKQYADTVKSMQEYANNIRNSAKIYDLDGTPVTNIVLSKKRYNESDNIAGLDWADKVDAAIASGDINAIRDLASYGYAWYGTDKGKNLNPMRALRMDSQGRIMQSGESKGAWIGLGIMGGVGLLAALACYGKEKGWFNGMQKKQSLHKAADFNFSLSDDDVVGDTHADKYKSMNDIFANIAAGKNMSGFYHGPNNGKVQSLFLRSAKQLMPYTAWKEQMEAALAANDTATADKLLAVRKYYAITDDPKNTYDDIAQDSNITESLPLSDKDLTTLYAGHPKLQGILAAAAQHRQLMAEEDAASKAQSKALRQNTAVFSALEKEKAKALKAIDAKANSAFNAYYDAQINKATPEDIERLRNLYAAAQKEYDIAAKPYDERMIEHNRKEQEAMKPYNSALQDVWKRLQAVNNTKL